MELERGSVGGVEGRTQVYELQMHQGGPPSYQLPPQECVIAAPPPWFLNLWLAKFIFCQEPDNCQDPSSEG